MKANHNNVIPATYSNVVVVNINKSKNESKSQRNIRQQISQIVVVNINKSKNESKSQQLHVRDL